MDDQDEEFDNEIRIPLTIQQIYDSISSYPLDREDLENPPETIDETVEFVTTYFGPYARLLDIDLFDELEEEHIYVLASEIRPELYDTYNTRKKAIERAVLIYSEEEGYSIRLDDEILSLTDEGPDGLWLDGKSPIFVFVR